LGLEKGSDKKGEIKKGNRKKRSREKRRYRSGLEKRAYSRKSTGTEDSKKSNRKRRVRRWSSDGRNGEKLGWNQEWKVQTVNGGKFRRDIGVNLEKISETKTGKYRRFGRKGSVKSEKEKKRNGKAGEREKKEKRPKRYTKERDRKKRSNGKYVVGTVNERRKGEKAKRKCSI